MFQVPTFPVIAFKITVDGTLAHLTAVDTDKKVTTQQINTLNLLQVGKFLFENKITLHHNATAGGRRYYYYEVEGAGWWE